VAVHDAVVVSPTLTAAVLDWGERHRRDLPWRATRDPWAVLVSELMLQQTQVSRVQLRWGEFLERFPTPGACAREAAAEVVRWWAGLGYNRRALYLHRCAVEVVASHGGTLPDTLDGLLGLPGIGPYTARAVLAFAHGVDVGVLDTNAARVLARAVAGHRLGRPEAQRLADAAVPRGEGWAWNQTILDLGATLCTTSAPGCERCPLAGGACRWETAGRPEPDPAAGSAGTSRRQSRFVGSDRQGRGRLVDALRRGPVDADDGRLADACGWADDPSRVRRIAQGLVTDGLARWSSDKSVLSLSE
jgi:A/G-specific adenine glycosylase